MQITQQALNEIKCLTGDNQHTEALMTLAVELGAKTDLAVLEAINTIHISMGYLVSDLQDLRNSIYKKLMAKCETQIGNFDAVKSAF